MIWCLYPNAYEFIDIQMNSNNNQKSLATHIQDMNMLMMMMIIHFPFPFPFLYFECVCVLLITLFSNDFPSMNQYECDIMLFLLLIRLNHEKKKKIMYDFGSNCIVQVQINFFFLPLRLCSALLSMTALKHFDQCHLQMKCQFLSEHTTIFMTISYHVKVMSVNCLWFSRILAHGSVTHFKWSKNHFIYFLSLLLLLRTIYPSIRLEIETWTFPTIMYQTKTKRAMARIYKIETWCQNKCFFFSPVRWPINRNCLIWLLLFWCENIFSDGMCVKHKREKKITKVWNGKFAKTPDSNPHTTK